MKCYMIEISVILALSLLHLELVASVNYEKNEIIDDSKEASSEGRINSLVGKQLSMQEIRDLMRRIMDKKQPSPTKMPISAAGKSRGGKSIVVKSLLLQNALQRHQMRLNRIQNYQRLRLQRLNSLNQIQAGQRINRQRMSKPRVTNSQPTIIISRIQPSSNQTKPIS